jgi:hypothetical protein
VSDSEPSEIPAAESTLTSCVLTSPADGLLRDAIDITLRADPRTRAKLFEQLLRQIEDFMKQHPNDRPWSFSVYTGTDGSRIFRGGTGRSIVLDPAGTMWRARSYEDFETTYIVTNNECRITSLTPHYEQMRRYPLT